MSGVIAQIHVVCQSAFYLNDFILNKPVLPQRSIHQHFAP